MKLWLIVPAKPFAEGKTRLAEILSPEERARLNRDFLDHTLDVATAFPGIGRTIVVSADPAVLDIVRARGATIVEDPGEADLNAALDRAAGVALDRGADAILVLPADLPRMTPEDLAAVTGGTSRVVIVPDRRGAGTNALYMAPPQCIPFRFGPDSFRAHVAAAREAGVLTDIVVRRGLRFDVDTPGDYREWVSPGRATDNPPDG